MSDDVNPQTSGGVGDFKVGDRVKAADPAYYDHSPIGDERGWVDPDVHGATGVVFEEPTATERNVGVRFDPDQYEQWVAPRYLSKIEESADV